MVLLLAWIGPVHPPTSNDHVPLGFGRAVVGWASLPFVLIGRSRGWATGRVLAISGLSALIHVVLSLLLGLLAFIVFVVAGVSDGVDGFIILIEIKSKFDG